MTANTRVVEYHIAEYQQLRSELLQNFRDSYSSVTYAIFANAAIVAWISSSLDQAGRMKELIIPAACLPVFISLVAWALYTLRRRSIQRISDYCKELEANFASGGLGWEKFYGNRMQGKLFYVRSNWVFNIVCLVQLLLSIYFLYFVTIKI